MTSRALPTSWWRLWAIQASWGPKAMQGLGMAVAALPWMERSRTPVSERRAWLASQLEFRNTNPYLAGLVVGAGLRVREQAPAASAHRLEQGLDRAAGAIGDSLFWGGLWPAVGLWSAVGAWLWGPSVALVGWGAYALLQGWVRDFGLRRGYSLGAEVVKLLERPRVGRAVSIARGYALAGAGALAGLLVVTAIRPQLAMGWPTVYIAAALGAGVVGTVGMLRSWPPERAAVLMLGAAWAAARGWEWLG